LGADQDHRIAVDAQDLKNVEKSPPGKCVYFFRIAIHPRFPASSE
jgi:hypothetical protein